MFGLCAAIAPPAQASTLLTNQAQGVRAVHGVRFFVLGAVYDTDVKGARTLRSALDEARADVTYVEVPEGHAAETFRGRIDDALHHLIPASSREPVSRRGRAESSPCTHWLRASPPGTGTLK